MNLPVFDVNWVNAIWGSTQLGNAKCPVCVGRGAFGFAQASRIRCQYCNGSGLVEERTSVPKYGPPNKRSISNGAIFVAAVTLISLLYGFFR